MYSKKLARAFALAAELHQGQVRKGSGEPYLSHVLGVAALVIRYGGNEEETAGALLHDAAEDCGGEDILALIRKDLGPEIESIVRGCSDSLVLPKPPWEARKEAFINSLPSASSSIILVSNCDKIYNLGTILDDYRVDGEDLWNRFMGEKNGTLWYYRTLTAFYTKQGHALPAEKLQRILLALEEELINQAHADD